MYEIWWTMKKNLPPGVISPPVAAFQVEAKISLLGTITSEFAWIPT